ncbi:MAG: prepilin peptidase, partial [Candidatus Levyibacteriota bacterium]
MLIELFLVFIIGLCVGSFINAYIDRSVRGESVIFGKSHCDNCKKNIAWYDLIPLVSYIHLGAKCRHCKSSLSFYYPITEFATGAVFVLTFASVNSWNGSLVTLLYWLTIVAALVAIFFVDLKYGIIPDKIVYPAVGISLIYLYMTPQDIVPYLLSAVGASVFLLILLLVTRGKGMGWGDVKFVILMGLILGFPGTVVGLYLAFLTGAVVGVILILWRKKKLRGSTIPFGPFLVVGTILSLFYSQFFINL